MQSVIWLHNSHLIPRKGMEGMGIRLKHHVYEEGPGS